MDTPKATSAPQAEVLSRVLSEHEAEPHPWLADDKQLRLHASLHTVVESQLSDPTTPFVARAFERLQHDGLTRHEAIHAIADVASTELMAALSEGRYDAGRYRGAIEALDADEAREREHERIARSEPITLPTPQAAEGEGEGEQVLMKVEGDDLP
ncbi:MAG: hypothetical protein CSA24_00380 [Deltaproteobacteria bacterium]|nr:MAG: hypothetical protein CSB49_03020 [Pseudomonadota bacterium]PIE66352.1 MAG: hypothetical protein CSA24_00380 [Deltaproteobacteria bacterium]